MSRSPTSHRAAHGKHKAASLAPSRVEEALVEFRKLNSREARAAFADYWIGIWAQDFDYAWPMLYELLHIVEEERLYTDPRRVGPAAPGDPAMHGRVSSYETFEAYFEDRVKQNFARWRELEGTYQYAHRYARDLFDGPLGNAQAQMDLAKAERQKAIEAADDVPLPANGEIGVGRISLDNIKANGGTSESYLRRRLKRDHPEIYERVAADLISAHAGAVEAGIRKRTQSVRMDSPESAAATLRKHMSLEARQALARLLLEE